LSFALRTGQAICLCAKAVTENAKTYLWQRRWRDVTRARERERNDTFGKTNKSRRTRTRDVVTSIRAVSIVMCCAARKVGIFIFRVPADYLSGACLHRVPSAPGEHPFVGRRVRRLRRRRHTIVGRHEKNISICNARRRSHNARASALRETDDDSIYYKSRDGSFTMRIVHVPVYIYRREKISLLFFFLFFGRPTPGYTRLWFIEVVFIIQSARFCYY